MSKTFLSWILQNLFMSEKTLGLKICCLLLMLGGAISIFVSLFVLTGGVEAQIKDMIGDAPSTSSEDSTIRQALTSLTDSAMNILRITAVISLIFGVAYLPLSYFLWKLNPLARKIVIGLYLLSLAFSVITFVSTARSNILEMVLAAGVLYVLLFDQETKKLFVATPNQL